MMYFLVKFAFSGNVYFLHGTRESADIIEVVAVRKEGFIRTLATSLTGIYENDPSFQWIKIGTYEEMKAEAALEAL